jgi:hypothetical protein
MEVSCVTGLSHPASCGFGARERGAILRRINKKCWHGTRAEFRTRSGGAGKGTSGAPPVVDARCGADLLIPVMKKAGKFPAFLVINARKGAWVAYWCKRVRRRRMASAAPSAASAVRLKRPSPPPPPPDAGGGGGTAAVTVRVAVVLVLKALLVQVSVAV